MNLFHWYLTGPNKGIFDSFSKMFLKIDCPIIFRVLKYVIKIGKIEKENYDLIFVLNVQSFFLCILLLLPLLMISKFEIFLALQILAFISGIDSLILVK